MTEAERDWLTERFEEHRSRLHAVAHRMLGSAAEADDAVQEAWLRLSRADASDIVNLRAWLTTVVSRVCLNVLQARRTRPEVPLETLADRSPSRATMPDPEGEALLADSIGVALLVVLDTLTPAERVAFVLHDTFAVPFDEIAPIVGRSTAATRQLASRARRRVQGRGADDRGGGAVHAKLVEAFLAAARNADFGALLAILDPDVVLRPDEAAVKLGAPGARGAERVASWFSGRARGARPALANGAAGALWMPGGNPRVVFRFTSRDGKIVAIDLIATRQQIADMKLVVSGE